MLSVYANTPENMQLADIAAHAQRAEAMGFDGLHVPDAIHDGLLLAALALNATRTLKVGTSVLVAFPRSPMVVALAAWDLQRLSGGRFELGLGTQIKSNIVDRYSAQWTAAMPQMRDYLTALRAIFHSFQHGTALDVQTENYRFTRLQPFFNPGPLDCPPPPLYIGAVGPLMTKLAGEMADGLITHPTNTPPRYIREVMLPRMANGLEKAQRQPGDVRLVLGNLVATAATEEQLMQQREKQRQLLGFLYSTPPYWPSLELFGWQHKGEQLLAMSKTGDWRNMAEVIDDEMLETVVPCAVYDEIAGLMRARYQGMDAVVNFPLPDNPADDKQAAQAIARLKAD